MAFTAAAVLNGLHGLIMKCITSQVSSCSKLSCMIDADLTATSLVSGSFRIGLVFDEVFTSTVSVSGSQGVCCCTARVWCASRPMC